jgi:hypothetical protein
MSTAQQRDPADDLHRAVLKLEELERDCRLHGRARPHTHDLEERAQAIAREIVAAFRGVRPVAKPLGVIAGRTVW